MSDAPGSPKAARLASPSWLDGRLVLGVLLVLASVLVGAKVLASADRSQQVWVATHDLPAGTVLAAADLEQGRVRLFGSSVRYAAAGGQKPLGYLVRRSVGAHELLPVEALQQPGGALATRDITVPVPSGHLPPDLRRGDLVDVYVTPSDKATRTATSSTGPRLVLESLVVARMSSVGGLGASSQDQPVVLTVAPDDVLSLVAAMGQGRLDLVRVPHRPGAPLVASTAAP